MGVQRLPEEVFKEIAYAVAGITFELHNRYGRYFGERTYKFELARECMRRGLPRVELEVPIRVSLGDFVKCYYLDVLINGGALFELKAMDGLTEAHASQTLNYLFLAELNRAKVFNLGAERVQDRFVSTQLTLERRREFTPNFKRWDKLHVEDHRFQETVIAMLNDWGGFLSLPLYQQALTQIFGGEDRVIQHIPVVRDGIEVCQQPVHLLRSDTAFKLTALPGSLETAEEHMRRFLHHTKLRCIQWVNMYHHEIQFITLRNDP
jgi:GxxExxY protein